MPDLGGCVTLSEFLKSQWNMACPNAEAGGEPCAFCKGEGGVRDFRINDKPVSAQEFCERKTRGKSVV